jgi:hypothetical protein
MCIFISRNPKERGGEMSPMIPYPDWIINTINKKSAELEVPEGPKITLSEAIASLKKDRSLVNFTVILALVNGKQWNDQEAHEAIGVLQEALSKWHVEKRLWALDTLKAFDTDEAWNAIEEEATKNSSQEICIACQKALNIHHNGGK